MSPDRLQPPLRTADFAFDLPPEHIAAHPARPRDAARLLRVGPPHQDWRVRDLPDLLRPGDLLVFNDTRVIPARLHGLRDAVPVAITLHQPVGDGRWRAFARPGKRLKVGSLIRIADDFALRVEAKGQDGEIVLTCPEGTSAFTAGFNRYGSMPLPPYIPRPAGSDSMDREDYQTVFAHRDGAVAAPTAGLHFTPDLLARLKDAGMHSAHITLHVGAGTFLPVKAEDPRQHPMHSEWGEITPDTAARLSAARRAGQRLIAVGTTALRLLESAATPEGDIAPFCGETRILLLPGDRFRAVDGLLTNFHLPRSTLFMLVCAFAGTAVMQSAYAHAIANHYRFYSFGDASLLFRADPSQDEGKE